MISRNLKKNPFK